MDMLETIYPALIFEIERFMQDTPGPNKYLLSTKERVNPLIMKASALAEINPLAIKGLHPTIPIFISIEPEKIAVRISSCCEATVLSTSSWEPCWIPTRTFSTLNSLSINDHSQAFIGRVAISKNFGLVENLLDRYVLTDSAFNELVRIRIN